MNSILQLLWAILKDILSIILLILQSLWQAIVKLSCFILRLARKTVATSKVKLAQAKEQLPGQIEKGKEAIQTAHQKLQEVRDNWPAQMDAAKQWAQKSGKNISEASKHMSESLQQGMASAHTRLESLRESIDNPQPATANVGSNTGSPRQFKWKKKYTWGIVAIVLLIGAVNATHKSKKSGLGVSNNDSYTTSTTQSDNALYNNSQTSSSSAEDDAIRAEIWAEHNREMNENMRAEQEQQKLDRIRQKDKERQDQAELDALKAANRRMKQDMEKDRIKNTMSHFGVD